jgi:hypothetical protein
MKTYLACCAGPGSSAGLPVLLKAMKVYLACNAGDGLLQTGITTRVLCSYYYFRNVDLNEITEKFTNVGIHLDIFADSGAYSAFTQGKTIVREEYAAWVSKWSPVLTVASAPDVIGDVERTNIDTEWMISQNIGIPVLPVFHVGEPWSVLDAWCKREDINYIALGGMVPLSTSLKLLQAWCSHAFARIPKSIRVHGFGQTQLPIMLRHPWYSVDSTSWSAGVRFANLVLFDHVLRRLITVDMRSDASLLAHAPLLQRYGLKPGEMRSDRFNRIALLSALVRSWRELETYVTGT